MIFRYDMTAYAYTNIKIIVHVSPEAIFEDIL